MTDENMRISDWQDHAQYLSQQVGERLNDVPRGAFPWQGPQNCVAVFVNDGHAAGHLNYLLAKLKENSPNDLLMAIENANGASVALILIEDATLISNWIWESWAAINGKPVDGERDPQRGAAEDRIAGFLIQLDTLYEVGE